MYSERSHLSSEITITFASADNVSSRNLNERRMRLGGQRSSREPRGSRRRWRWRGPFRWWVKKWSGSRNSAAMRRYRQLDNHWWCEECAKSRRTKASRLKTADPAWPVPPFGCIVCWWIKNMLVGCIQKFIADVHLVHFYSTDLQQTRSGQEHHRKKRTSIAVTAITIGTDAAPTG